MSKTRFFRVIIAIIVMLLLLAAGAALLLMPKKAASYPDFSAMPTDTAGYNMIGNLPENLASGGFMAGQNGWIYFTNFSDGGKLYMCREKGADMVKLTDFPVCNINVLGSSMVFTGFDSYAEFESKGSGNKGGKLYVIYGLHTSSKLVLSVIDPDTTYFSPYLDRDGLYVSYSETGQSALANKINGAHIVIREDMGELQKQFPFGNTVYAQMSGGRIVRLDAKALFPLDFISGRNLHRIGGSFVFHGADSFVYELIPADGTVNPISSVQVTSFSVNAFGEIITSDKLIISKKQRYGDFAQTLLSKRKSEPITMQNGWYSYYNIDSQQNNDDIYFSANGKYYSYGLKASEWSEAWLNTKLGTEPLVSLDDVIVEDLFTPNWVDFSEDMEPIDPADSGDFGSERPVRPVVDDRADAANDAGNALDAAILLLIEDESIADKYTGESVEKLRSLYGSAFETALTDSASELSKLFATRSGINLNPQEAQEILAIWLRNANYEISGIGAASNGKEAGVMLTVKTPVDVDLVYDIIDAEGGADSAYAEIMREPERHGFMSSAPESAQIYMRMASDDCWIAENPDKLIRLFIRGLDERS